MLYSWRFINRLAIKTDNKNKEKYRYSDYRNILQNIEMKKEIGIEIETEMEIERSSNQEQKQK